MTAEASTERAEPEAKLDRAGKATVFSAYLGWLFDYYELFILTFLIIPIAIEFDLTPAQTAAILAWSLASLAVGGVTMGYAADRFGRRPILILTIAVYSVATLARAFAPDYHTLLILTIIAGIGIGGEYGVGQALVSESVPSRRRGFWSGLVYGACFFGIMVAALVGGYVMPEIGWRWTFALSCLPVLLTFLVRAITPESEIWQREVKSTNNVVLRDVMTWSFARAAGLCTLLSTVYFAAYYGIATFLPKHLVSEGMSMSKAAWWVFFTGLAGLIGNITASYAMDRLGRRRTLTWLMVVASVSSVVLAMMWTSLVQSNWILIVFFFVFVGANGATVFGALFSEMFPTSTRTTGISTSLQIARGLMFFVPFIITWVLARYGFVPIVVASAVAFALVGCIAWLFPERANVTMTTIDDSERPETASVDSTASRRDSAAVTGDS